MGYAMKFELDIEKKIKKENSHATFAKELNVLRVVIPPYC